MEGYERPIKRAGKTIGYIAKNGTFYIALDVHRRPLRGSHSQLDALDAVWRSAEPVVARRSQSS
jgi:hypothetical protein